MSVKVVKFVSGLIANNSFLIVNDELKEAVLIDAARSYAKVSQYLKDNGLKLKSVLFTHGHFDHIENAALFKADGVPLYIHKYEADKFYDGKKNLSTDVGMKLSPTEADYKFEDGEIIKLAGIDFKVLLTPGHSVGSSCFICENYIFSGDTLFNDGFGRVDFFDSDAIEMRKSIKKLFALKGDYIVYPGHGAETTLQKERERGMFCS